MITAAQEHAQRNRNTIYVEDGEILDRQPRMGQPDARRGARADGPAVVEPDDAGIVRAAMGHRREHAFEVSVPPRGGASEDGDQAAHDGRHHTTPPARSVSPSSGKL